MINFEKKIDYSFISFVVEIKQKLMILISERNRLADMVARSEQAVSKRQQYAK